MRALRWALLCACVAPYGAQTVRGQALQRVQEQTAFQRAREVSEPEARIAALKQFAAEHPGTSWARRAEALQLETLLQSFPERTAEIHTLAAGEVAAAPAGFERWTEEARLANLLANAGSGGADLADARPWAQDAVAAMTEESYRRQMRAVEVRYKLPPLTAAERHREFTRTRASFLAALASVDLRSEQPEAAEAALAEAGRLDPLSSEVSSLRGQLALARHQDRQALEQFERAEAEGDLKEPWRTEMVRLYSSLQSLDAQISAAPVSNPPAPAGLNDAIDALYARLFPPLYQLSPRKLPAGGHTVLLELFTGAGCQPCVAPDLAVESLLGTYGRQDLVVLEYDEHIPRPDPLANPDTVNRAANYRVGTTPQAFADGEEIPVGGASRSDVENVVIGFADEIESRAAAQAGVGLQVAATRAAANVISVNATVRPVTAASAPGNKGTAKTMALPSSAVVRFALVEDHVRYSGENGIRFHRMVVRAMEKATASSAGSGETSLQVRFDPAAIARNQQRYLEAFTKINDQFGEVHFLTTDIPLDGAHLGVAVWVEDPGTHAVLQAAYAEVPAP